MANLVQAARRASEQMTEFLLAKDLAHALTFMAGFEAAMSQRFVSEKSVTREMPAQNP